jgi:hypothetical protein
VSAIELTTRYATRQQEAEHVVGGNGGYAPSFASLYESCAAVPPHLTFCKNMNLRPLLPFLLLTGHLHALEPRELALPDSKITLSAPDGWDIKKFKDTSIYPPTQPAHSSQSRMHLETLRKAADSLEAAVEAEIDSITERSPESCNARKAYKGSVPVKTDSGIVGLRADFYTEHTVDGITVKRYQIAKYYFKDEAGKIFRVCAHVYGDEPRMKMFEAAILANLKTSTNQ